jgi:hypothetical protein
MRLGQPTILRLVTRALVVILLTALAFAGSSCGGGRGDSQLSRSEYEAKIGSILRPIQGATLQNLVTLSAADREGAVQGLKAGESKLHDAASELESMKPPDDAVEPTLLMAKGVRAIADEVTAVRKDAERGDFARLVRFKVTLASDPAVSEIRDGAVELINLGYNIAGQGP